jgi:hypothetical protein
MISTHQRFKGASDLGPELDLAGDGAFHHFARDPGVQEQRIRNLDRLTHVLKVAKRYQLSMAAECTPFMASEFDRTDVRNSSPKSP